MAAVPAGLEFLSPYLARLDRAVENNAVINEISAKTSIHRAYIALCVAVLAVCFVFFGLGASLLSTMVGTAYPAYCSFVAIESPDKADDLQWLTYWVVFAVFSLLETFSDTLLFWFPFYYTVKVAFLVYCQSPYTRGAEYIYRYFLRGQFIRFRPKIEEFLNLALGFGSTLQSEARAASAEAMSASSMAAIERGAGELMHRAHPGGASSIPADPSRIFGSAAQTDKRE